MAKARRTRYGDPWTKRKRVKKATVAGTKTKISKSVSKTSAARRKDADAVVLGARLRSALKPKPEPTQRCLICSDSKPSSQFKRPTKACTHPPTCCQTCLENWCARSLNATHFENIFCPSCSAPMRYEDFRSSASADCVARYETIVRNADLSSAPGFRWCLAPGCESGQIHVDNQDNPLFECEGCGEKTCVACDKPWHGGKACQHTATAKKQEKANSKSKKYLQTKARKCPGQDCGRWIQRDGGCPHIYCTFCKTSFCWNCGQAYVGNVHPNANPDIPCVSAPTMMRYEDLFRLQWRD